MRIIGRIVLALALGITCWVSTAAQATVDFQGDAAEQFLLKTRITKMQGMPEGVTAPRKATLQLNGVTRFGLFKTVDIYTAGLTQLDNGQMEVDFTDSWHNEIAAYIVDRIIGLGLVPATVERRYDGKSGSMQWWIDAEMTENDRVKNKVTPPDDNAWNQQRYKMLLFDNLLYNTDRHLNNIFVTKDFSIRLIDQSRTFRSFKDLKPNNGLTHFSRSLLAGLEKLDRQDLSKRIGKHISARNINYLLQRRDAILTLAKKLVAEKGEENVLYP